tara:strand:- start:1024 stop:2844 length:1821 start_codon:yes stop_codon:yes gene_type:complete
MCGIAGYIGKEPPSQNCLVKTLDLMKNRGPDHNDFVEYVKDDINVSLLHSRLAVIDLDSRSNQPFRIGKVTIVYNGEIYNYIELRSHLIDRGIKLYTKSDTEVLLNYYKLYGTRCVNYFEGMWAFAIHDENNKYIFFSRDRFSEKPLFYMKNKSSLYFGSEIKYIQMLSNTQLNIDLNQIKRYLFHGYKSLYKKNNSFFSKIRQLKYGENLVCKYDLSIYRERYWFPKINIDQNMSMDDAISGSKEKLINSIGLRLRSDVPSAFCLSGGIDSSSIVSIAAKIFNAKVETFSIIDDDSRYNENNNIHSTIRDLKCNYNLVKLEHKNTLQKLTNLIKYHDSPISTITYYIHSLLSKEISRKGFKVSFSGTSADELFTGYYDHYLLHLNEVKELKNYNTYYQDWLKHVKPNIRNPILKDENLYKNNPNFREHIYDGNKELKKFSRDLFNEKYIEQKFTNNLLRNRMLNELFYEATPVILHEDDLNSMFYSIENRSPYLDSKLFDFAYSIPARHLIKKGLSKFVLRESVKGILNDDVRLDRRKIGFNASISSILNFSDPDVKSYLLTDSEIFSILDKKQITKILKLREIPNYLSKFIFNFINAKIFLEKY